MSEREKYNGISMLIFFLTVLIIIKNFLVSNMQFLKTPLFMFFICFICLILCFMGNFIFWLENKLFSDEKVEKVEMLPFNVCGHDKSYNEQFECAERIFVLDNASKIDRTCFSKCSNLVEVYFSGDNTELSSYAFLGCTNLKKVKLPKNLKRIESYTFAFCESLKEIELPVHLEFIGKEAFAGCSKIVLTFQTNDIERVKKILKDAEIEGSTFIKLDGKKQSVSDFLR